MEVVNCEVSQSNKSMQPTENRQLIERIRFVAAADLNRYAAMELNSKFLCIVACLLLVSSCAGTSSHSTKVLSCVLEGHKLMTDPPENAGYFRNVARAHPNDPNSFGPPPQQQKYSNQRWDRSNEFWYTDEDGGVNLYCNTDDSYVYRWRFQNSHTPEIEDHGVIYCSG